MREKLYRKEVLITVGFALLLILTGHTATLFVIFPGLQTGTIWGFPTHYLVPILVGWFGVLLVCVAMAVVCNRFDDELEEYVRTHESASGHETERVVNDGAIEDTTAAGSPGSHVAS